MRPKHPWVRGRWTISRETEQSGPACCVSSVAWVYSGGLCALVKFPTQDPGVPSIDRLLRMRRELSHAGVCPPVPLGDHLLST